ncbi:MAG TPA: RsmB/NOP family class I SAM-dependent RNA methyltransferase [Clostridia bacterium]|nr:RsmB/NOP family class I SAM-dependent RNA methyltransferase [Clostridia bacterium]
MRLPEKFLTKMKNLMMSEKEFEDFLNSFLGSTYKGLRVNTLKIDVQDFLDISPFELECIEWTDDGFYYHENEQPRPGKHPYYNAGLYYIQEPSAMYPASVLSPQSGDKVLDLCAAPGGKTIQLASYMKGKGILICNEINSDRAKVLVRNVELYGIKNIIVINEPSEKLSTKFTGYFDKILVDAPCSGEGMFKKDENAIKSWKKHDSSHYTETQLAILKDADKMLKPGGKIVYSTCTFSPEENEDVISKFLDQCKGYSVLDIPKFAGIEDGRPEWSSGNPLLQKTARLWPHLVKGEGHYTALLQKSSEHNYESCSNGNPDLPVYPKRLNDSPKFKNNILIDPPPEYEYFEGTSLNYKLSEIIKEDWVFYFSIPSIAKGNENPKVNVSGNIKHLYYLPADSPNLSGLRVPKQGLYLGECKNGKFTPSHSFLCTLKKCDFKMTVDFPTCSREVDSFLKCETPQFDIEALIDIGTFRFKSKNGFIAFCVDGNPLGWVKYSTGVLKNLYPKGWRILK